MCLNECKCVCACECVCVCVCVRAFVCTNLQHEWYGLHLYWSRLDIASGLYVVQEVWRKLMVSSEVLEGLHGIGHIRAHNVDPMGIAQGSSLYPESE